MKFVLRDDDVNYFTQPIEIEAIYGKIWNKYPVSLCVVPFMMGRWDKWIKELYNTGNIKDVDKWEKDTTIYPIGDNKYLVSYLTDKIKKKISLCIHGIHHRNLKKPYLSSRPFIITPEFDTDVDLTASLRKAILYLEDVFKIKIKVFTPPNNRLSKSAYKALLDNNLSFVSGGIPQYKKKIFHAHTFRYLSHKLLNNRFLNKGRSYPYLYNYSNRFELDSYVSQTPYTTFDQLKETFNFVREKDGIYVLSTHYNGYGLPLSYDSSKTLNDIFIKFLNYTRNFNHIEYVTFDSLI
ncbi:DUF2334 domain-containing protein [Bacteroidetes bacterium endosymbiont of Geopemphigus sp.]|uniref:DUF2334 domain-containing protein n=1 Tax=Bacteroidetes bacterium endosymbiont of Geopemphigus sp. TaxID=2047937 RepID=UPI0018A82C18|nr:DUF2334 domain-containing protein [Bacteroidetes bacterium endosymbiont of Geopemphigus sp.]